MIPYEFQYYIDKINTTENFRAIWNAKDEYVKVLYNDKILFPMYDGFPALLSRQSGYDLEISEMFKTELNFQSAEEKFSEVGENELYHTHYYFFTRAISESKVEVLIKYFDTPASKNITDHEQFLNVMKTKVISHPNYNLEFQPFGEEEFEMKLDVGGFRMRPKTGGAFYFTTQFDAETYGDVMLKVDKIIHDLEN